MSHAVKDVKPLEERSRQEDEAVTAVAKTTEGTCLKQVSGRGGDGSLTVQRRSSSNKAPPTYPF